MGALNQDKPTARKKIAKKMYSRASGTNHRPQVTVNRLVSDTNKLLDYAPMLVGIDTDEQRDAALSLYRNIRDTHPEYDEPDSSACLLASLLAKQLDVYGKKRYPNDSAPGGAPAAVLQTLLEQYNLRQSDLPDVGTQSVISGLVNGRREFNAKHVSALVRRFGVPAEWFLV